MTRAGLTASQTVGPFFHPTLLREDAPQHVVAREGTPGERIRIEGCVLDGVGAPVPDALVEVWQADSEGLYQHPADTRVVRLDPAFTGFARSGTDEAGRFWFETIRPGAVPFDGQRMQAPHISLVVFARGLLAHLYTRLYFAGDPANAGDPILRLVPADRRGTLLAQRDERGIYRFDIVLQGEGETVFFNPRQLSF
jgi:protocatechuate 3,4-dioxygenase alpha subunit